MVSTFHPNSIDEELNKELVDIIAYRIRVGCSKLRIHCINPCINDALS